MDVVVVQFRGGNTEKLGFAGAVKVTPEAADLEDELLPFGQPAFFHQLAPGVGAHEVPRKVRAALSSTRRMSSMGCSFVWMRQVFQTTTDRRLAPALEERCAAAAAHRRSFRRRRRLSRY